MTDDFHKFPRTSHLAVPIDCDIRDDKVMSKPEQEIFLRHKLVVEEKVDGANLGISFDQNAGLRFQNRGEYLHPQRGGQWKKLTESLAPRADILFEKLADRYILFGEWCYAQHSVLYDRLPAWFLGFDVFDKENLKFLSCPKRDAIFRGIGISGVPVIKKGHFTLSELEKLLSISSLGNCPAEGIYLRQDQGDWLEQRAKLVRPEFFIQPGEEHWSQKNLRANLLKTAAWR